MESTTIIILVLVVGFIAIILVVGALLYKVSKSMTDSYERLATAVEEGNLVPIDTVDRIATYQNVQVLTHITATAEEQNDKIQQMIDRQTEMIDKQTAELRERKRSGF